MRWSLLRFVAVTGLTAGVPHALLGCASSDPQVGGPQVTDVSVSAEPPAPTADAVPAGSVATPRRAAVERVEPTEVPPEPAIPASDLATARELFKEGIEAFDAGDMARAEAKFAKAYSIAPKPQVLFNLARVLLMEGKRPEACAAYEKWWRTMSPPDPSKRSQLPISQCPNLATLP